ncbi:MAG: short chain dehydrogenase [Nocardioides sp.]|nr:short chain dehydrogenase [Nocardioides sp.]
MTSPATPPTLITGASSGLGAEMARQLAAHGRDLALCARRHDRLWALRDEILAAHPERRVVVRELDVDDAEAVFATFRDIRSELGTIGCVVVNAGLGKGAKLGSDGLAGFEANRATLTTNLIGGLAQVEAAMEVFRDQGEGHLVVVSSVAALRGMPKAMTAYAASKAGLAHLAEGLRVELYGTPLQKKVPITVLYPGYIESEMNERVEQSTPLLATTERGVRSMVAAIEKRVDSAAVPGFPWLPLSKVVRHAPLPVVKRLV